VQSPLIRFLINHLESTDFRRPILGDSTYQDPTDPSLECRRFQQVQASGRSRFFRETNLSVVPEQFRRLLANLQLPSTSPLSTDGYRPTFETGTVVPWKPYVHESTAFGCQRPAIHCDSHPSVSAATKTRGAVLRARDAYSILLTLRRMLPPARSYNGHQPGNASWWARPVAARNTPLILSVLRHCHHGACALLAAASVAGVARARVAFALALFF